MMYFNELNDRSEVNQILGNIDADLGRARASMLPPWICY